MEIIESCYTTDTNIKSQIIYVYKIYDLWCYNNYCIHYTTDVIQLICV